MSLIKIYENLSSDMEDILSNDDIFLQNCKNSNFNWEEDLVEIEDEYWNIIKMWDHQRDEFIGK